MMSVSTVLTLTFMPEMLLKATPDMSKRRTIIPENESTSFVASRMCYPPTDSDTEDVFPFL